MRRGTHFLSVLIATLAVFSLLMAGCEITNYPLITDQRGGYAGVIRTGHKAYIKQENRHATIWPDGSDETFSMVYQNSYGDRKIYNFNNFDPTASVIFLDDTYCDWRYEGCALSIAWDPHQDALDDPFDHVHYLDCSGTRSVCLVLSYSSRFGECGDGLFGFGQGQEMAAEFADLPVTQWRGERAYVLPVDSSNTSVILDTPEGGSYSLPIYGRHDAVVTERLDVITLARPSVKAELRWMLSWVEQNGPRARVTVDYGSVSATVDVEIEAEGLRYNLARF